MKQIYKTTDGREFSGEESAKRHEELIEAENNFNKAKEVLARRLFETQFTADGVPFDFKNWKYYYVREGFWSRPSIEEISFCPWKISFDYKDSLELNYETDNGKSKKIDFKNLYYFKKNALKKHNELLAKYIEELKKEL